MLFFCKELLSLLVPRFKDSDVCTCKSHRTPQKQSIRWVSWQVVAFRRVADALGIRRRFISREAVKMQGVPRRCTNDTADLLLSGRLAVLPFPVTPLWLEVEALFDTSTVARSGRLAYSYFGTSRKWCYLK